MPLPNRGDTNWDVPLNAAISGKLDASSLDAAVAALASTPTSALHLAMSNAVFHTYATQAAALAGLAANEFADGDIVIIGP